MILTGIILSIHIGVFLDEEFAKVDALYRVNETRPSVNVRFVDVCIVLYQVFYNLKIKKINNADICVLELENTIFFSSWVNINKSSFGVMYLEVNLQYLFENFLSRLHVLKTLPLMITPSIHEHFHNKKILRTKMITCKFSFHHETNFRDSRLLMLRTSKNISKTSLKLAFTFQVQNISINYPTSMLVM